MSGAEFLNRLASSHRKAIADALGIETSATERQLRDALREMFPAMSVGGSLYELDLCPLCNEEVYGPRPHRLGHSEDCPMFLSRDQDRAEADEDWDKEQARLLLRAGDEK